MVEEVWTTSTFVCHGGGGGKHPHFYGQSSVGFAEKRGAIVEEVGSTCTFMAYPKPVPVLACTCPWRQGLHNGQSHLQVWPTHQSECFVVTMQHNRNIYNIFRILNIPIK